MNLYKRKNLKHVQTISTLIGETQRSNIVSYVPKIVKTLYIYIYICRSLYDRYYHCIIA